MAAVLRIWTKHKVTVREVETALHNCYTKGYLIVGGFSCVEQRLSTEALGDDPHLNPPPSKGEEMALTLTVNGETRAPMQCRNLAPLFLPPPMGEG